MDLRRVRSGQRSGHLRPVSTSAGIVPTCDQVVAYRCSVITHTVQGVPITTQLFFLKSCILFLNCS